MKRNYAILFAILLTFAFCVTPLAAQNEANRLLDLLANPPEDGILIIETEAPSFMYVLSYVVLNISTGEYYDLNDIAPCAWGMPSGFKGRLLVPANCEGDERYYLIENGQVKKLTLPANSGVYVAGAVIWTPDGKLSFIGRSVKDTPQDIDIYVWDGTTVQNISQNDVDDFGMVWSPDGKLAFASGDKDSNMDVYVWDGVTARNIWQHEQNDYASAWSPDGRLAIHSDDGIYVWDGTEVIKVSNTPYVADFSGWSPDGKLAFTTTYQSYERNLYIWDGRQTIKVSQKADYNGSVVWGPDNQLAFLYPKDHRNNIYIWQDGVLTQPIPQSVERRITWNRDGRLAFVVSDYPNFSIYTWDGQKVSLVKVFSVPSVWDFRDLIWVDAP